MSKRKVNLFNEPIHGIRKKFARYRYIRNTTIGLSIVFFVGIIVAYIVQSKFTGDLLTTQAEKSEYEKALELAKVRQLELHAIAVRIRLLRDVLNKDISFASQSGLLTNVIEGSNSETSLSEIAFTNKTDFRTTLDFENQDNLLMFIKASETNDFRKHFKTVSVGDFSISMASTSANQKLEVSGSLL